jgi:hypothetical protein
VISLVEGITDLAFGNGQWVGVARSIGTLIQSNTSTGAAVAPAIVLPPVNTAAVGDGVSVANLLVSATGTDPFTARRCYNAYALRPLSLKSSTPGKARARYALAHYSLDIRAHANQSSTRAGFVPHSRP